MIAYVVRDYRGKYLGRLLAHDGGEALKSARALWPRWRGHKIALVVQTGDKKRSNRGSATPRGTGRKRVGD